MKGLTKEERHQWHGQPGNWTCKRCYARITGALHQRRNLDDGICSASLSGRLDFAANGGTGGEAARPTRLDTPETVDKGPRQGSLASVSGSTGKGRHKAKEQGGKR